VSSRVSFPPAESIIPRYAVKSGDKINLMVKPGYTPAVSSAVPPPQPPSDAVPDITVDAAGPSNPSSLAGSASVAAASGSGSVVADPPSPASALYSADFLSRAGAVEFWISLKAFLDQHLAGDVDQVRATFETWLNASKDWLTPSQVAKIRDSVGITGMNGA
jgi:hypothetical protein